MPPRSRPDPELGKVVRRLREQRGESQEGLAYRAGITSGALARVELAQSGPAWATVKDIAEALGVSMAELAAQIEAER